MFSPSPSQVTVHFLVELDKLTQLLESPIFTHLRLQLLEPQRYAFLVKALYGLLMLLPQVRRVRLARVPAHPLADPCVPHTQGAPQLRAHGVPCARTAGAVCVFFVSIWFLFVNVFCVCL